MTDGIRVTVLAVCDDIVVLDFGQPVERLELPVDDALTLAMTIMQAISHSEPRKIAKAIDAFNHPPEGHA